MMESTIKTNWLWDSRLSEQEVRKIFAQPGHQKFDIYTEKLLARVSDPTVVFSLMTQTTFCQRWPKIKRRLQRDRWLTARVAFWQTIYERVRERLQSRGIKLRMPNPIAIPPLRLKLAHQIRAARLELGYTQQDLARKLGVIQQYVSKIETGHENMSLESLKRLADVLGKSLMIKLQ